MKVNWNFPERGFKPKKEPLSRRNMHIFLKNGLYKNLQTCHDSSLAIHMIFMVSTVVIQKLWMYVMPKQS